MITYEAICRAIATTLKGAVGVTRVQCLNEITETVPDLPLLQIYGESGETDSSSDDTAQTSFQSGVRQTQFVIQVDGYARLRSMIGLDMLAQIELIDSVDNVLSSTSKPYFGVSSIQGFNWQWSRTVWSFGNPLADYAGVRFTITVTVF